MIFEEPIGFILKGDDHLIEFINKKKIKKVITDLETKLQKAEYNLPLRERKGFS